MRKAIIISVVVAVALATTGLLWSQAQAAAQGQGRGNAYVGKPMPPNTPGATFTVIRGGDLQTIVNQTGGDTAARVVTSPAGNYGVFVLTAQPSAPRADAPPN